MEVTVRPDTLAARLYPSGPARERYYCRFGVDPAHVGVLADAGMVVSGVDQAGEPRIVEMVDRRFCLATLFVPQTSSTPGTPHPIVAGFVAAVHGAVARRATASGRSGGTDESGRPGASTPRRRSVAPAPARHPSPAEGNAMREPTTARDPRFSDPDTAPTSWPATVKQLEAAQLSWITTVRADGRPHVTPLVAVWLDSALHFCTGAEEQKAVNLRTNPHVTLTTGCNTWDRGVDVVVEGDAVPVTDEATLQRLAEAWRAKWDGRWQFQARDGAFHHDEGGAALVFAVAPTKVLAFGKGTFTHTRHVF
jgi:nitroimidazol reductase NimA-like FMN-containing flavoprotein (pyridoxamine 5'-phosphate oxidase superfamily)